MPEPMVADLSSPSDVAAMADALRVWEPRLDLAVYHEEPSFFDADGTVYGIALSDLSTVTVRHKPRIVRRGDAIVVPGSVSIDAEPGISLMAIRHDGVPPVHFRERFIQSRGMDHLPAPEGPGGIVIADAAARYRISYDLIAVFGTVELASTDHNRHLLIVFSGNAVLIGPDARTVLTPDQVVMLVDRALHRIEGTATIGRVVLETETAYESRKFDLLARNVEFGNPEFTGSS